MRNHRIYRSFFSMCLLSLAWTSLLNGPSSSPIPSARKIAQWERELRFRSSISDTCGELDGALKSEIAASMMDAAEIYGMEPEFLLAVMRAESRCEPNARSHKGAMGLMQLAPRTAAWLGVKDPYAVRQNIHGGARYLALLLKDFGGDLDLTLAAYNAGPNKVRKYGKIPPYRETKSYVREVLRRYRELAPVTKV